MYRARHFYAPVLLAAIEETNERTVLTAVSDLQKDVTLNLTVNFRTFDGTVLKSEQRSAVLPAGCSLELGTLDVPEEKAGKPEEIFCEIHSSPDPAINNGEVLECVHFFAPAKNCELVDPGLLMEISSSGKTEIVIQISAEKPAFHVVLDTAGLAGRFSDNDFAVMPNENKVIRFFSDLPCSEEEFRKKLSVTDLYKSYH